MVLGIIITVYTGDNIDDMGKQGNRSVAMKSVHGQALKRIDSFDVIFKT